MAKNRSKNITSSDLFSIHFVPTLIVFLVMMLLSGFLWRTATETIVQTQDEQVGVRSQFVENSIMQRFNTYDNAIRSATGLFEGSEFVDRGEWQDFVEALDIENQLPAMIGLGYLELVTDETLPAYEERMRSDGFENFKARIQDSSRGSYSIVTYLEPQTERNISVIGADAYTEEVRRQALEKARDEDTTTVTEVVEMLQADNTTRQNGITLYHPIYNKNDLPLNTPEDRREALSGYVYAPLHADKLFGDIFKDNDTTFNFQVYDGDTSRPETLLFERFQDTDDEPYLHVKSTSITVNNQEWTISYSVRDDIVSPAIRERPNSIAVGGIVFSLLVAGVVYLLLQRRSRQLADNENRKLESAKDSMLSLASHQLRTPATGVKQYLGMVLEGFAGEITKEQKELLQKANESNERQLRIINEFLYLAKAEADRVIVSPQKFDLGELAHNVVSDMQSEILQPGHTLTIKQRAKFVPVYADMHSARMILENLISNAVKYTPAGGKIKVVVTKHRLSSAVTVTDNGVGIEKKDIKKIFRQFSRIPNELSRQESGSGIGLFLVKYLAELNGGKITVVSKRHEGSSFTVVLPNKTVKNITVSSKSRD